MVLLPCAQHWQAAASFVLLIVFLIARPQGIFGKPIVDRA